jgi:hypothetical protein
MASAKAMAMDVSSVNSPALTSKLRYFLLAQAKIDRSTQNMILRGNAATTQRAFP